MQQIETRADVIYRLIFTVFSVLIITGNIISPKIFSISWPLRIDLSVGLLVFPLIFFLSDLVTECFGKEKAKQMVHSAFFMSLVSYGLIKIALLIPAKDPENGELFRQVFDLNGLLIFASLLSFMAGQRLDIYLYSKIKHSKLGQWVWFRSFGSTFIAQIIDTSIISLIYFWIGMGFSGREVVFLSVCSFLYKVSCSLALAPLYSWVVSRVSQSRLLAAK